MSDSDNLRMGEFGEKDEYLYLERLSPEIVRVFITTIYPIVLENLSSRFLKPNIPTLNLERGHTMIRQARRRKRNDSDCQRRDAV